MFDVSHTPSLPLSSRSNVVYRPTNAADAAFLLQMLEGAFNWREDPGFDRSLLGQPQVAHYLTDWPRDTDFGVLAEVGGRPVGAAWARYLPSRDRGYGYISDAIPEITMAVAGGHRGQGIGRGLLDHLINTARQLGVEGLSLSVEDGNTARRLYKLVGFTVVGRDGDSDTMSLTLNGGRP